MTGHEQFDPRIGLCGTCRHSRRISSHRGSIFWLCERARTDVRFPRYPRLPVVSCVGFETFPDGTTMSVRTRFAPSPTGDLHLGNARTAILNWLVARHANGQFVVRFEDTDAERNVARSGAEILEGLDWLGLDRDEDPERGGPLGPYRQSERVSLYRQHAEFLLERGLAFRCYCSTAELEARRTASRESGGQPRYDGRCRKLSATEEAAFRAEGRQPAIRFAVRAGPIVFDDRIRGRVTIDGSEFGDFVILRSDGSPTYNFAVVVDDVLMRITHVIRGVGHLANTPKQVLIYGGLGASLPEFVHIPTVLAPGGGKLSKREGAPGLLHYRDQGYHPDAVVNYLSLLSWSSARGEEILTPRQLVEDMDLDRIGSSDTVLDIEKMRWLSGQHIHRESSERLAERVRPFLGSGTRQLTPVELRRGAEVVRERVFLLTEAAAEIAALFAEPDSADAEARTALSQSSAISVLAAVAGVWAAQTEWTREAVRDGLRKAGASVEAHGAALYRPVRAALTGRLQGPEVPDVAYALGRDRSVARLQAATARAESTRP